MIPVFSFYAGIRDPFGMGQCASMCGGSPADSKTDNKMGTTAASAKTNKAPKTNGKGAPLPDPALDTSFHAQKMLGSGTAGDIWLCKQPSKNQRAVAVKLFPRPFKNGTQTTLLREVQVTRDPLDQV